MDHPPDRKKSILFGTHRAMSRGLADRWVMTALIRQALFNRRGSKQLRSALSRIMPQILSQKWLGKYGPKLWEELLTRDPSYWLEILHKWDIDPEFDDDPSTDDDPVPEAVRRSLYHLDTDNLYECLQQILRRKSINFDQRVEQVRKAIKEELRSLWQDCIGALKLKLPLLILDEAHHLKNPQTRLASLFHVQEAEDDFKEISRGALGGVFEHMLFLTATPFQLGHGELCSVLERFGGISWKSSLANDLDKVSFTSQVKELRSALDASQEAAVALDNAWGFLHQDDLVINGDRYKTVDEWWRSVEPSSEVSSRAEEALYYYYRTHAKMRTAELLLRPWVIRHLKPRYLPKPHAQIERRHRYVGQAMSADTNDADERGIIVSGANVLPFLLAARASSHVPDSRPVFAEGLASSYEAFLQTRMMNLGLSLGSLQKVVDDDDSEVVINPTDSATWYLDQLDELLPRGDSRASMSHPKISETVKSVADLWESGEKVVIFCHYVATGRALRNCISVAIDQKIKTLGAQRLGIKAAEVPDELERIGRRFFNEGSRVRRASDEEVLNILKDFDELEEHKDAILEIVRRNIRTPSFLVRFFPLRLGKFNKKTMIQAFDKPDRSRKL